MPRPRAPAHGGGQPEKPLDTKLKGTHVLASRRHHVFMVGGFVF